MTGITPGDAVFPLTDPCPHWEGHTFTVEMLRLKRAALALPVALGLAVFAAPSGSATVTCTGPGTVEHVTFPASSQGATGDYSVYLPACYFDDDSTRYPSVYLLHGLGEGDTHWLRLRLRETADLAISQGDIEPMILVMTDGGPGYEVGRDGVAFDAYLVDELVPRVDASYRTVATRDARAVGGISRGGKHALAIAAKTPEMFAAAGGHSPRVEGAGALARALTNGGVRVWLDVGRDDHLHDGSVTLAHLMRAEGGSVQLHVPAGAHESAYWRSNMGRYLAFYDDAFNLAGVIEH